ncbi:PKS-ER domain-containing protein [Fusarium sp. LHS14.1]|nr:PKS-ER domain-containing protein [Fusarium sp. LHS14.1]
MNAHPRGNGPPKSIKTTMRAQQYDPADQKLHLNKVEIPKPNKSEILVKVVGASLCHSDCLTFDPDLVMNKEVKVPTTIGHEATGIITEVGKQVRQFEKGDAVGFLASSGCFECDACTTWSSVGCPQGLKAQGFTCDGYFQEYVVVDARSAVKLPASLDVAFSAPPVIGAGGVGQMGIQYAKAMGLNVIAVDIDGGQLDAAKMGGADYTFNPELCPTYADDIKIATEHGVDAAVSFAPSEKAYDDMPGMIRWGGLLMVVGVVDGPLTIEPLDIIFKRYVIKTACNGTVRTLEECISFSAEHSIKPFVEFIGLEDLPQAIEMMEAGKLRKRVCVKF